MQMPARRYDDGALQDPAFDGGLPQSLIMGTGSGYSGSTTLLTDAEDNFTVELWVKPTAEHEIDGESQYGASGVSGQKFVIDPVHSGGNSYVSGMGISVGTNGVSVYEHADYYLPALLVWESPVPLTAWTHVAVVYENKQPKLYINGALVKTGLQSIKSHVYPGNLVASGAYGTMEGQVDEVRVWNHVLTQAEIQAGMNSTAQAPQAGLTAYWPIRQSDGTTLQDISGNDHPVQLNSSYSSTNWSSDAAALQSYNRNSYRYAFNGKERDGDIGEDDYDYGWRISDSRLGRFLSVDPITAEYSELTPYQFASNSPIANIDRDGLESSPYTLPDPTTILRHPAVREALKEAQKLFRRLFRAPLTPPGRIPIPIPIPIPVPKKVDDPDGKEDGGKIGNPNGPDGPKPVLTPIPEPGTEPYPRPDPDKPGGTGKPGLGPKKEDDKNDVYETASSDKYRSGIVKTPEAIPYFGITKNGFEERYSQKTVTSQERVQNFKSLILIDVDRGTAKGAETLLILINSFNIGGPAMSTRVDNKLISTANPIYLAQGATALISRYGLSWISSYLRPENTPGPNNINKPPSSPPASTTTQ